MSGIVFQNDAGTWQVIVVMQQLFGVLTLKVLVICSGDRVAVGELRIAIAIHVSVKHGGFAETIGSQHPGAPSNFSILFLAAEPSQQRHDAYGALVRDEPLDEAGVSSETFKINPSRMMKSSSVLSSLCSLGRRSS